MKFYTKRFSLKHFLSKIEGGSQNLKTFLFKNGFKEKCNSLAEICVYNIQKLFQTN